MEDIYSNYDPNRDFITLVAWKRAREVRVFFYKDVIPKLPPEERFNLNTQIRKASVSGTVNIAEGYGRYYPQESIQFYRVARASVYELKDHLISCHDNEYITNEVFEKGLRCIEVAKVAINGYVKYVMRRQNPDNPLTISYSYSHLLPQPLTLYSLTPLVSLTPLRPLLHRQRR